SALAPLETSDRCELPSPRIARLSKTHCIARPGSPTKEWLVTGRSNQRLTVTIGDAAVDSAARSTLSSAAGRSGNTDGSAYQAVAQMMAFAGSISSRTRTVA